MWVTITEFRSRTKISMLPDEEIKKFIETGQRQVMRYCFEKKNLNRGNDSTNSVKLEVGRNYIADSFSKDGTVDKNDIYAYELDNTTFTETDVTENIISFKPKYGFITMDGNYPSSEGLELHFEYYIARYPFEDMYEDVRNLTILFAVREMLVEKPIAAKAMMSSTASIAGFSFESGADTIGDAYNNLDTYINIKVRELQPLRISSRDTRRTDNPYTARRL